MSRIVDTEEGGFRVTLSLDDLKAICLITRGDGWSMVVLSGGSFEVPNAVAEALRTAWLDGKQPVETGEVEVETADGE